MPVERTDDVSLPKKSGRGGVDAAVRYARQTGNPNLIVAEMAAAIIARHRPREKVYERNLLKRAIDAGNWAMVDGVMMLDTADLLIPCESGRIRQATAIKQALAEFSRQYPDGISAPTVRLGTLAGRRTVVIEPPPSDAPRRKPNFESVEKILRNLRQRG